MDMALLWDMCQGSCWGEGSGISHHVKKLGSARGHLLGQMNKKLSVPSGISYTLSLGWPGPFH